MRCDVIITTQLIIECPSRHMLLYMLAVALMYEIVKFIAYGPIAGFVRKSDHSTRVKLVSR